MFNLINVVTTLKYDLINRNVAYFMKIALIINYT